MPRGLADLVTVLGIGVMVYAVILLARRNSDGTGNPSQSEQDLPRQQLSFGTDDRETKAPPIYTKDRVSIKLGSKAEVRWIAGEQILVHFKEIKTAPPPPWSILHRFAREPEPCALVSLTNATAVFYAKGVSEVGVYEYLMFPATPGRSSEHCMLYEVETQDRWFAFSSISLMHLNTHAAMADFEIAYVDYRLA